MRLSVAHRKRRGYRWCWWLCDGRSMSMFEVLIIVSICTVTTLSQNVEGYNSTRISPKIQIGESFANKNKQLNQTTSYLGYNLSSSFPNGVGQESSLPMNATSSISEAVIFDHVSNLNSTKTTKTATSFRNINNNLNSNATSNLTNDELITSDSRSYHSISRDEQTPVDSQEGGGLVADTPMEEDTVNDVENYIDEASSNLNEKKVVKEITKMLSKGMSGATDQVKLETLENWKRRSKERKVIKDSRAKLFEDLLTAAISSHPDKIKKRTKKPKSANSRLRTLGSLSSNPDLDPEMALDADNVISHLHGIASVLGDGSSSSSGGVTSTPVNGQQVASALNSPENLPPTLGLFGNENNEETSGESSGETEKEQVKKTRSSGDRLIVKQFKKIKQQISQRRKQLDQIKKIFNVELSLNPKDGSLMGKSTGNKQKSNKENAAASGEVGGSEEDPEEGGSSQQASVSSTKEMSKNRGKNSMRQTNQTKMKELMDYLRNNPEILASVMSELTVGAEPGERNVAPAASLSPSSLRDDESHIIAPEGSELSAPGRRSVYHNREHNLNQLHREQHPREYIREERDRGNDIERLPYESQNSHSHSLHRSSYPRRQSVRDTHFDISNQMEQSPDTAYSTTSIRRSKDRDEPPPVKSLSSQLKVKSAESLLLESLRERQLMNLARLDMVLAERQMATSNNRSYVPSHSSNSSTSLLSRRDSLDYQRSPNSSRDRENNLSVSNRLSGRSRQQEQQQQSDGEVLHHFMMVNQDADSTGGQSPINSAATDSNRADQFSRFVDRLSSPSGQSSDRNSMQSLYNQQAADNSLSSMAGRFMDQQPQQQSNQQAPLGRFKDWRDVSQVETSPSILNDKTDYHPPNVTWVPYDLSTGSSVNTITDAHKSASTISNHYQRHTMPPPPLSPQSSSPSTLVSTMTGVGAGLQQELHNATNQDVSSPPLMQDNGSDNLVSSRIRQELGNKPIISGANHRHPMNADRGDSSITRPSLSESVNMAGNMDSNHQNVLSQGNRANLDNNGLISDNTLFMTRSTVTGAIDSSSTHDTSTPSTVKPLRVKESENTILNRDNELPRRSDSNKTGSTRIDHGDSISSGDDTNLSLENDSMLSPLNQEDSGFSGGGSGSDDDDDGDKSLTEDSRVAAPTVDYFSAYKQDLPSTERSRRKSSRNDQVNGSSVNRSSHRQSNRRPNVRLQEPVDIVERGDMGAMWAKAK